MPSIVIIGAIMIAVLAILLVSVYTGTKRSYFRIINIGDRYIIQYRMFYLIWRTYTIPNTGEAAIYYVLTEAEDMIKTLVERVRTTSTLNAITAKKIKIFEYSKSGIRINKK